MKNSYAITSSTRIYEKLCPVCGSLNKIIDMAGHHVRTGFGVQLCDTYYHCKKCGYFRFDFDSNNHKEYKPYTRTGISLSKKPLKAMLQALVLRKHYRRAVELQLAEHEDYELKLKEDDYNTITVEE